MILIIVGIVLYVGMLLDILAFRKMSARADTNMRIVCYGELSYSNFVRQYLLKFTTEDKKFIKLDFTR